MTIDPEGHHLGARARLRQRGGGGRGVPRGRAGCRGPLGAALAAGVRRPAARAARRGVRPARHRPPAHPARRRARALRAARRRRLRRRSWPLLAGAVGRRVARDVRPRGRPVGTGDGCRGPGRRVPTRPPARAAAGLGGRPRARRAGRVLWPSKPVDAFSSLVTVARGNGEEPDARVGSVPAARTRSPRRWTRCAGWRALVPGRQPGWNPIQTAERSAPSDRYAYAPLLFGYTNYSRAGFRPAPAQVHRHPRVPSRASRARCWAAPASPSRPRRGIPIRRSPTRSGSTRRRVQEGVYYDAGGQPGNAVAWESDRTNAESLDFFRGTRATLEGAYLRPRRHRLHRAAEHALGAGQRRRSSAS